MSFWTTTAGQWGLDAWNMDRSARDEERHDMGEYCPVCGYLLAAHLIDACPTEAEVAEWWGER